MGRHVLILSSVLTKDKRRHQTRAGATGDREPSDAGTGGQTQVLCKGSVCSYLWAHSPACILLEALTSFLMTWKCCANSFLLAIPPQSRGSENDLLMAILTPLLTPSFQIVSTAWLGERRKNKEADKWPCVSQPSHDSLGKSATTIWGNIGS